MALPDFQRTLCRMAKKVPAKNKKPKNSKVLSYKMAAPVPAALREDSSPYIVDTPRKQRASTVAASRKYAVEFVSAAKSIATGWLKTFNLENAVGFGLPEVDDRYHIWQVPLVKSGTKPKKLRKMETASILKCWPPLFATP